MKNKNLKSLVVLSTLFVAACSTTPPTIPGAMDIDRNPANAWSSCFDAVGSFFGRSPGSNADVPAPAVTRTTITEALAKASTRFPNGYQGQQGKHIQYGFESEYLRHEAEILLKSYMPLSPYYNGSKEEWLALSHAERAAYIESRSDAIFPYREKGKLVKITDDAELDRVLPDSFVFDAGHYEIVLDPMDNAEELIKKIKTINAKIGIGSMQMTISNPIEKDLLKKSKAYQTQMKEEVLGYYNFMNEFDTLAKLTSGYERYLVKPDSETVKSFNHPWLGPMTKLKHERLVSLMDNVLAGKQYTDEELKQMSSRVVSHKFIGGLAFRPDVAFKKNRLASEVRDCHQNVKCIENRIIRETYFLMKGKSDFTKYAALAPFDSEKTFDVLPKEMRLVLRTIFPKYGNYSQVELELHRNFAYPFRDWSKHVETLGRPELTDMISAAQKDYRLALENVTKDFIAKKIDKAQARNKVMGALGEFSKKSGIADAMKSQYENHLSPDEMKYFEHLNLSAFINHYFLYSIDHLAA